MLVHEPKVHELFMNGSQVILMMCKNYADTPVEYLWREIS